MKIAVLFPQDSPVASWNMGRGIVATLDRLGVEALAVPMPTAREASEQMVAGAKAQCAPLEDLANCDLTLISGPEHIGPWIDVIYGKQEWRKIPRRAAWLHESCRREDCTIDFAAISWMADDWFFPAIQDAEWHDQEMFAKNRSHWLPFGVDVDVFCPGDRRDEPFEIAFMGLVYPKRHAFLNALSNCNIPPIRLGSVNISDLHGYRPEESVRRYAGNLREMKVFFNLPALSQVLVGKVFEVLACGTFLLTPLLRADGGISRNMTLLHDREHLLYYRASNLPNVASLLREWSSDEKAEERNAIAAAGCREVHEKHSLDVRMAEVLSKLKIEMSMAAVSC